MATTAKVTDQPGCHTPELTFREKLRLKAQKTAQVHTIKRGNLKKPDNGKDSGFHPARFQKEKDREASGFSLKYEGSGFPPSELKRRLKQTVRSRPIQKTTAKPQPACDDITPIRSPRPFG